MGDRPINFQLHAGQGVPIGQAIVIFQLLSSLFNTMIKHALFAALCALLLVSYAEESQIYAQAQTNTLTPKCQTLTREGDPPCWMKAQNHARCYAWNPEPGEQDIFSWHGNCRNGLAHGYGKETGSTYLEGQPLKYVSEGEYVDGKAQGHWSSRSTSALTTEDVTIEVFSAEGLVVDGKMNGKWVVRIPDVLVMEGPMVNNKHNGHWVVRHEDGTVDEGPMVNGEQHGRWIFRYEDGSVEEGPMVKDVRHGRWVERNANGDVAEGPYVNGKEHGRWTIRKADGVVFTSLYVNGELQHE